jgi:hypothetical protein
MTNIQQLATVDKLIEDNQALREEVAAVWEMVEQATTVLNMAIRNRRKARLTKPQRGFAVSNRVYPREILRDGIDYLMDSLMDLAVRRAQHNQPDSYMDELTEEIAQRREQIIHLTGQDCVFCLAN